MDSATNTTEVCILSLQPSTNPVILDKVQASLILGLGLLSCVLSLVLGYFTWKSPTLHCSMRTLAVNVVLAGLLRVSFVTPFVFTTAATGKWMFNDNGCKLLGVMHDLYFLIRILLTVLICTDRLSLLLSPDFYKRWIVRINLSFTLSVWIVFSGYVVLSQKLSNGCLIYLPALKMCTIYSGCPGCATYSYVFFGVFSAIGLILPVILFSVKLFKEYYQQEQEEERPQLEELELQQMTPDEQQESRRQEQEDRLLRQLQGEQQEEEDEQVLQEQDDMDEVQIESGIEAKMTNRTMILLLLSPIVFYSAFFLLGILQLQGIVEASTTLYRFQALGVSTLIFVAPVFDCIAVFSHKDLVGYAPSPVACLCRCTGPLVDSLAMIFFHNVVGRPTSPLCRLVKQRQQLISYGQSPTDWSQIPNVSSRSPGSWSPFPSVSSLSPTSWSECPSVSSQSPLPPSTPSSFGSSPSPPLPPPPPPPTPCDDDDGENGAGPPEDLTNQQVYLRPRVLYTPTLSPIFEGAAFKLRKFESEV